MKKTTKTETKKPILNKEQLDALKNHIDEKLRLRCINVETKIELIETANAWKIDITSTSFNTVPVIHSPITIGVFGSSVKPGIHEYITTVDDKRVVKENNELIFIYLDIVAVYKGNCERLFTVQGAFNPNHRFIEFFPNVERKIDPRY